MDSPRRSRLLVRRLTALSPGKGGGEVGNELTALGLLLDRTYAETAVAGRQPQRADRAFLTGQFNLWITHLRPAVAAASAPRRSRRSAARAVWRSLAHAAGPGHQRWLRSHVTDLGFDAGTLLDPAARDDRDGAAARDDQDGAGRRAAGIDLPPGPGPGRLADLGTTQYLIFRMLRRVNHPGHPHAWELEAAGTLGAGLGSDTTAIAGALGRARRERLADRRLRTLAEARTDLHHAYLTRNAGVLGLRRRSEQHGSSREAQTENPPP